MPRHTLIALPYSPWSEKARWALDHHGIDYREIEYTPMLGEPVLRIAARKFRGKVSVPILLTPHGVINDSFAIAEYANRIGRGTSLGFAARRNELLRWNDRSEAILGAGRTLVLERMLASPAALLDSLPSWVPAALRPAMRPMADVGVRYVRAKYAARGAERTELVGDIRRELDTLRTALEDGRPYVLEEFSHADVAMAVAIQVIDPVEDAHVRIGDASREIWRDEDLARSYGDLLRWRDEVYRRHRNESPSDATATRAAS